MERARKEEQRKLGTTLKSQTKASFTRPIWCLRLSVCVSRILDVLLYPIRASRLLFFFLPFIYGDYSVGYINRFLRAVSQSVNLYEGCSLND